MKSSVIRKFVFALAGCLYASSASAGVVVQAGAGHPHLGSGTSGWANEWSGSAWLITDGRSILPNNASAWSPAWDTPIPISATNATWTVIAYAGSSGSGQWSFSNRICTFSSSGAFYSCGSTVGAGSTSQATVPTDGSAYSQSLWSCGGEFCAGGATLYHIKAY
ncbi:MAG: hypothetical protein AMXMBFR56_56040 [Polyangiaceae bacterium]